MLTQTRLKDQFLLVETPFSSPPTSAESPDVPRCPVQWLHPEEGEEGPDAVGNPGVGELENKG